MLPDSIVSPSSGGGEGFANTSQRTYLFIWMLSLAQRWTKNGSMRDERYHRETLIRLFTLQHLKGETLQVWGVSISLCRHSFSPGILVHTQYSQPETITINNQLMPLQGYNNVSLGKWPFPQNIQ